MADEAFALCCFVLFYYMFAVRCAFSSPSHYSLTLPLLAACLFLVLLLSLPAWVLMACKSAKPGTRRGEAERVARGRRAEILVDHVKEPEFHPEASKGPQKAFKPRSHLRFSLSVCHQICPVDGQAANILGCI